MARSELVRRFSVMALLVLWIAVGGPGCVGTPEDHGRMETRWVDVAAGIYHVCALADDGEIDCWGCDASGDGYDRDYGQCARPAGRFIDVAAGWYHTCAVREDGALVCWGCGDIDSDHGQCDVPQEGQFVQVDVGLGHSCALSVDGQIVCWGCEGYGNPACGPLEGTFVQVEAGSCQATCGLTAEGQVVCTEPYQEFFGTGADYAQISLGIRVGSCALTWDGRPVCDDDEFSGGWRLDDRSLVRFDQQWRNILGITSDGGLLVSGYSSKVRLPEGRFEVVSMGEYVLCAIDEQGRLMCWDSDDLGTGGQWL